MHAAGEPAAAQKPSRTDMAAAPAVRLDHVTLRYAGRRGTVTALEDLSLELARGEILAVVGPSGCGKSTLLELICGLQRPDEGAVHAQPAVLMPQRDLLLPWASALDNAGLALRAQGLSRAQPRRSLAGAPRARRVRRRPSRGALGRDAPARLVRALAARRQGRARARRAVRLARCDHPRGGPGVAGGGARRRAAHGRARHP